MLWNKPTTKQLGDNMEDVAKQFLIGNGLEIVSQNFHCRFGEIDIIASSQQTLIFVEVKYRKNNNFGGAANAVSASKQKKLIKSAQIYLQQQQLNEYNTACRFDVIAIEGAITTPQISWLKNAF